MVLKWFYLPKFILWQPTDVVVNASEASVIEDDDEEMIPNTTMCRMNLLSFRGGGTSENLRVKREEKDVSSILLYFEAIWGFKLKTYSRQCPHVKYNSESRHSAKAFKVLL